jgi:photosystem II stability/assembly factor-like uncharacterized protein
MSRTTWIAAAALAAGTSFAAPATTPAHPARPQPVPAAPRSAALQKMKGIWEPVNYGDDIDLSSVYFVTPDVGWVSGAKGTILHTTDGGAHWTAQMGGDPAADEREIVMLRFIDETHGWGVWRNGQTARLLRTTDGERWVTVGAIPYYVTDYVFTSPAEGVAVDGGKTLVKTADGGKTWAPAAECAAKVEVDGLARNVECGLQALSFPTSRTGYAIGAKGAAKAAFLLKTDDGGATWSTSVSGTGVEPDAIAFVSETQGYYRNSTTAAPELFKTTDGGATWADTAGSPGARLRFADPEVGWAFNYRKWTFTTDGGMHWSSRELALPAAVEEWSFPRRDRAYVVGPHGMIYRYRVVPATEQVAKAIEVPAMPGLDPGLMDATTRLDAEIGKLDTDLAAFQGAASADAAPPAAFVQDVGDAESSVAFAATQATVVLTRQRNLNLLVTALEVAAQLPRELDGLRGELTALKSVHDAAAAAAAAAALTAIKERSETVRQLVQRVYQKQASVTQLASAGQ